MAYTIFREGFYIQQWRLAGGVVVRANVKRPCPVIVDEADGPPLVAMVLPDWVGPEYAEVMAAYVIMELRVRVSGPVGVLSRLLVLMRAAVEVEDAAAD